ncbi:MAG TPA: hypothetical protein VEK82_16140 [Stellaceae bacterium]|nr:hypothetical protein [Stellaceae bacterium]
MSATSLIKRAGGVAAIALALTAAAAPNMAYARHGQGAGIALGIIGTMLAGAAIASAQAGYAAPPAYYYQPQGYDTPPGYYEPPAGYYQPSPYGYYR